MAFSFNANDLRLGPCSIDFDGVNLGGTIGGVKVKLNQKYTDLKIDQTGDAPIDSVLTSQEYTVELTVAASGDKDKWKIAMPYSSLEVDGVTPTNKAIFVNNQIGRQLNSDAAELVLHPLAKADSDKSEDFKFFKAVCKSAIEVEFDSNKQRGLKLEFTILPDFTTTPAKYFIFGDPTLDPTLP